MPVSIDETCGVEKTASHEFLRGLFGSLANSQNVQIFVHGSWADSSKTAFSDLDDFIILDTSIPQQQQQLIRHALDDIAFSFQRLDPLQHHGHWIISKNDLDDYDNSYIPLFILKDAISISGIKPIKASVNPIKTRKGLIKNIQNTCSNIEAFYFQHKIGKLNLYNLKCLVGSFALLPALIFQLKELELNKRDAINRAGEILGSDALELLRWSTDLRNRWGELLIDERYSLFSKKLNEFSSAVEWRSFAKDHAPVIDYSSLSEVELNKKLVDHFISQSLLSADQASFKRYEAADYEQAYHLIEEYAWDHGALAIGQFGVVKWPSISDMDVFICFPDQIYHDGITVIDKIISSNETLSYLFAHSPLYIASSMLPWMKYLHTLYDLKITRSVEGFTLDKSLERGYIEFYNIIWTLFLCRVIFNKSQRFKFDDSRSLLLLIKNIHTSTDNLKSAKGKHSNVQLKSDQIREKMIKYGLRAKSDIQTSYENAVTGLFDAIDGLDQNVAPIKKSYFVTRSLLLCYADKLRIESVGDKTIYYLNGFFFNFVHAIYSGKTEEVRLYYKALEHVMPILTQSNAQDPFIRPFAISPLEIRTSSNSIYLIVKRLIVRLINILPSFVRIYLFKRI